MSDPSVSDHIAQIVRQSRSNLAFALLSLPRERREDMHAFYAFCRVIDDIADDEDIPLADRKTQLARWRDVIHESAREMTSFERSVVALRDRYGIPPNEMEAIIDGVSMDLEPLRFENWEALRGYCYRVASSVGLVSIRIFGCRMKESREYAIELGYALQLTNILRDIHGDWQNGARLYLPLDDLAAAGYSEDDIAAGCYNEAFRTLMAQQIARARHHYAAAQAAHTREDAVPLLASEVMRRIYSETLDLLENDGARVYDERYHLSKARKIRLVAGAWVHGIFARLSGRHGH
jgi:15-cis-phytoene synthase